MEHQVRHTAKTMSQGRDAKEAKPKRRRLPLPEIVVAIGLVLCFAPLASDLWSRHEAEQAVSSMTSYATAVDSAQREELLAQAGAYNAHLGGYDSDTGIAAEDIWPYERQLAQDSGSSAMAALIIPRAGISLPIYHGDDEDALAQGVGHQETTSLPVGGQSSSVWLEGHSGLRTASLFDNIRVLEPGDVIGVNVLGQMYAYRVTSWEIVDPESITAEALAPAGRDTVTLVTCTTDPDDWNPKGRTGINDKRLLVHAVRCEYDPSEFQTAEREAATDVSLMVNEHSLQAILAVILLAIVAVVAIVRARRVRVSKRREI